jgi:hypothetical protein
MAIIWCRRFPRHSSHHLAAWWPSARTDASEKEFLDPVEPFDAGLNAVLGEVEPFDGSFKELRGLFFPFDAS